MRTPIGLAVFDMDGTLTKERNSWDTFFGHYHHDARPYYKLFFSGHMGECEWAETNLVEIMKARPHLNASEVERVLVENSHIRSGVGECVTELRSIGFECMIISCGLDPLAAWVGRKAGFRDWRANWYETDQQGNLLPRYVGKVFYDQKADWLRYWMDMYGIDQEHTVAIGDGDNDIGLFKAAGRSIGIDPLNERVASSCDKVVSGDDLMSCAELIKGWY